MPDTLTRTNPVPREEWGAEHGRGSRDPGPEKRVVIHHSFRPALSEGATEAEERNAVRGIERFHVETNGWAGIGYNWLVAPSGRIYEGRGWSFRGAHAGPVNGESIGVCLLIDGSVTDPGDRMIAAVRDLIADGVVLGEIAPDYVVSGHRDHMDRTCPGDRVYSRLQEFRHDAGPGGNGADAFSPATPDPDVVSPPTPDPAADDRLRLDRIEIPRREHIEAISRREHFSADAVGPGLAVAEVLLRGMGAAAGGDRRKLVEAAAEAIAEWRKGR